MSKYAYEVLIRMSATGVQGAHVVFAADMENPLTGEVTTAIGNAEPLGLAEGQAGLSLSGVLGSAAANALLDREAAIAAAAAAEAEKVAAVNARVKAEQERDAAAAVVEQQAAQLQQAAAAIEQLRLQLAALQSTQQPTA